MLNNLRKGFLSVAVGLGLILLLVACGDAAATPTPSVNAPEISPPLDYKAISLPKEISDYINKSVPSGTSIAKVYTYGLADDPAQVAATLDKFMSAAGYSATGKPTELKGVFTRFYKTAAGVEAVATYGSPDLSIKGYTDAKIAANALTQYSELARPNKTILGITTGTGLHKLYGLS